MSDQCKEHSNMCTSIGMLTEGLDGISHSLERLLSQSAEHYSTENSLKEVNEKQNISLALICERLETKEKTDDEKHKEQLARDKEKRKRNFSLFMEIFKPIVLVLITFFAVKAGLK